MALCTLEEWLIGIRYSEVEVRCRTQYEANAWGKVEGVMLDRTILKKLKVKVLRAFVTPACLYGLETVALTEQHSSCKFVRTTGFVE